jgi:hypothetical protein
VLKTMLLTKLKTAMAVLLLLVLLGVGLAWWVCDAPTRAAAANATNEDVFGHDRLCVTIWPEKTQIKPEEPFEVKLRVVNSSEQAQSFTVMSCSWDEHWACSNRRIVLGRRPCWRNVPTTVQLAPGEAYEKTMTLSVGAGGDSRIESFRLGFSPIGQKKTYWSNTVAIAVLLPKGRADAPKLADEVGLAEGKKMPTLVTDFVNGKDKDHCGCPSIMIANADGRGLIILSRGAVDSAFKLARALDDGVAEGDRLQRFLVALDADTKELAKKAEGLGRVTVGKARHTAKEELDGHGVDGKIVVLVFLLDKKDIKKMWSYEAHELDEEDIKELVAAAKKFIRDSK